MIGTYIRAALHKRAFELIWANWKDISFARRHLWTKKNKLFVHLVYENFEKFEKRESELPILCSWVWVLDKLNIV